MKTNLNFYSRRSDSHRHPKFKMLRQLYGGGDLGWAMEAKFWALNDVISEAEYCELDLSINRNKADVCEIIGLTLTELESFLEVLLSEDVQLLSEPKPKVYTTNKVKERLSSVLVEREKARKRKGSPEKDKNSPELFESSPEPNHKGKESKREESKRKESKVNTDHFFYETALNLFKSKTKIQNPTFDFHIKPICELFETIPENLTTKDIEDCVKEAFEPLSTVSSIRMDYLCTNIQQKINAKREAVCNEKKVPVLAEAREQRAQNQKDEAEAQRLIITEKLKQYAEFFTKNTDLFSAKEKVELTRYLKNGEYLGAGMIIEPKIEEIPSL